MTSEPPSPATAIFLFTGQQAGVLEGVIKAPPRVEAAANALALARAGAGPRHAADHHHQRGPGEHI
jgi:hypothetical protein